MGGGRWRLARALVALLACTVGAGQGFPDIQDGLSAVSGLLRSLNSAAVVGGGVVLVQYESPAFGGLYSTSRQESLSFVLSGNERYSVYATSELRPLATGWFTFGVRALGPVAAYVVSHNDSSASVAAEAWDPTHVPPDGASVELDGISSVRQFQEGEAMYLSTDYAYNLLVAHVSDAPGAGFLQVAWRTGSDPLSVIPPSLLSPSISCGTFVTTYEGSMHTSPATSIAIQPTFTPPFVVGVGDRLTHTVRMSSMWLPQTSEELRVLGVRAEVAPRLYMNGELQPLSLTYTLNSLERMWISPTFWALARARVTIDLEFDSLPRHVAGPAGQLWTLSFAHTANFSLITTTVQYAFGAPLTTLSTASVRVVGALEMGGGDVTMDACTEDRVPAGARGALLILPRGRCTYAEKVRNAQLLGAVAVCVYANTINTQPHVLAAPTQDPQNISIPLLSMHRSDALSLLALPSPTLAARAPAGGGEMPPLLWLASRDPIYYNLSDFTPLPPPDLLPTYVGGLFGTTHNAAGGGNVSHVTPLLAFDGAPLANLPYQPSETGVGSVLFSDHYGVLLPQVWDVYEVRFRGAGWVQLYIEGRLANWRSLPYRRTGAREGFAQGTVHMFARTPYSIELRWDVNRQDTLRVTRDDLAQGVLEWRAPHLCGAPALNTLHPAYAACPFVPIPQRFMLPVPCAGGRVSLTITAPFEVRLACVCPPGRVYAQGDTHCAGIRCEQRYGRNCTAPSVIAAPEEPAVFGDGGMWRRNVPPEEEVCSDCKY